MDTFPTPVSRQASCFVEADLYDRLEAIIACSTNPEVFRRSIADALDKEAMAWLAANARQLVEELPLRTLEGW